MDSFSESPLSEKQKAQREIRESCGYSGSFTGRFSSKLPWKETPTFRHEAEKNSPKHIEDDFSDFGHVTICFLSFDLVSHSVLGIKNNVQ